MKFIFICFILILTIQSCELNPSPPECKTPEELANDNLSKEEYNEVVFSYLQNSKSSDYRYFFKTFIEKGETTIMVVNFRTRVFNQSHLMNKHTCFDVEVLVQDWSILGGMRKVNGKSYPKELRKLKWELDGKLVKYMDMGRIID